MAIQYDINKIFEELEQQVQKKINQSKEKDEEKENDPIESPEDAPETKVVAPATSKTSEDTHGGDEASKEIKDSHNSVDSGENSDKENKSEKTKNTGNQGEENQNKKKQDKKSENNDKKEDKIESDFIKNNTFSGENKGKTTPEDLQKAVEEIFEKKKKKQEEFKTQNRQEYLKKYILEIIKKIAAKHAGIDKQDGSDDEYSYYYIFRRRFELEQHTVKIYTANDAIRFKELSGAENIVIDDADRVLEYLFRPYKLKGITMEVGQ